MAVKAGKADGQFASSDIAKAIRYAADNGADVICMSFGGEGRSALVESAVNDAFDTAVLIAAAGNGSKPTEDGGGFDCYPAAYSNVIGVMASDGKGNLADFSNWDYTIGQNGEYEIAAPGVKIFSTLPGNRFARWSGTSMAAANVAAAAAIIRNRYPNKNKYNTHYIMGQLISASTSTAKLVKGTESRTYPALNIADSLQNQPVPRLTIKDFYALDSATASEINNGDGIIQPNETLDLGVSLYNAWGDAKNVTVSVQAVDENGEESPYVEMISDTVGIGDIGTIGTGNNGFMKSDGTVTDVTLPLRFRIKDGVANDTEIRFVFTVTAQNAFDETDTKTYTFTESRSVKIQNRYVLVGYIHNMTLTADKYWIIDSGGVTFDSSVTVEPGTQIEFIGKLSIYPSFAAQGTEELPIVFFFK